MPKTFFVGDHRQMFPHLKERLIITVASSSLDKAGKVADNVALVNGKPFLFCYTNNPFKVNCIYFCVKVRICHLFLKKLK